MRIDIKHVAKLARLTMDPQQMDKFEHQMNDILDMVDRLPAMEGTATGLDPTHPMTLRADEVRPSLRREDVLKNAPQVEAGCVVVPRIVE